MIGLGMAFFGWFCSTSPCRGQLENYDGIADWPHDEISDQPPPKALAAAVEVEPKPRAVFERESTPQDMLPDTTDGSIIEQSTEETTALESAASKEPMTVTPAGEAQEPADEAPARAPAVQEFVVPSVVCDINLMDYITRVETFSRLPQDGLETLIAELVHETYEAGTTVRRQGEEALEFFMVVDGKAVVTINEDAGVTKQVTMLQIGDYFGEGCLVRFETRKVNVIAKTRLFTVKITKQRFKELGLLDKVQLSTRKAVGGGAVNGYTSKEPTEKTDTEKEFIIDALRRNANLKTMVSIDESQLAQMADVAWVEEVLAGHKIIVEGDIQADHLYIVKEGCFAIYPNSASRTPQPDNVDKVVAGQGARTSRQGSPTVMAGEGASFGELALLYVTPRMATVQAVENSIVWVIGRNEFKRILAAAEDEMKHKVGIINKVKFFSKFSLDEKKRLAAAMEEVTFSKDDVVIKQGDVGDTFYVLCEGKASVFVDEKKVKDLAADSGRSAYSFFGEKALLRNEPRAATVQIMSRTASVMALDRESFEIMVSKGKKATEGVVNLKHFVKQNAKVQQHAQIYKKELKKIGILGVGGTGSVELVEHKKTKKYYALKAMSKGYIVKSGLQEGILHEKDLLMILDCSFLIKFYESYNFSQVLYFLFEAALGGDLFSVYSRKGLYGSEKHCRFYTAGLTFAFRHMHRKKVVYRDLKPENVMLSEQGQIKLGDMDCAKFVVGKTYTTCGTPCYFSPEMISQGGHTCAVDWWSLGVLTFELMSGVGPFEAATPVMMYDKVQKGIDTVPFPKGCQGPVADLIRGLLVNKPSERLPCRPSGLEKLQALEFFKGFDWKAAEKQELKAPLKPSVSQRLQDIKDFRPRPEDLPPQIVYTDDGSNWDKDFATSS